MSADRITIDGVTLDTDGLGNLQIATGGADTDQIASEAVSVQRYKAGPTFRDGNLALDNIVQITVPTEVMAEALSVDIGVQLDQRYAAGEAPDWEYQLVRSSTVVSERALMEFGQDIVWLTWKDDAPSTFQTTWRFRWRSNDADLDAHITMFVKVFLR